MAADIKITWLCQGGFLFDFDGLRITVDPYMSDALAPRGLPRMQAVPISFDTLNPDIVLFTHAHLDHYDPQSVKPIYEKFHKCLFGGPSSAFALFKNDGFDAARYREINVGDVYAINKILIKAVKAIHSDTLAVGYVFHFGNKTVYLSGDTLFSPALASDIIKTAQSKIDIAIICINGRLGNMNDKEAVDVITSIKPSTAAIPMHYGLFAKNTADPTFFIRSLRNESINALSFQPGETKSF